MNPEDLTAIANFAELLFKIGVTEAPAIEDMFRRAFQGTDPLAGLETERVENILPELQLDVAMRSARLARMTLVQVDTGSDALRSQR